MWFVINGTIYKKELNELKCIPLTTGILYKGTLYKDIITLYGGWWGPVL